MPTHQLMMTVLMTTNMGNFAGDVLLCDAEDAMDQVRWHAQGLAGKVRLTTDW